MKIAAFTDHINTPSSRFRIRQYFPKLEEDGIHVHDYYRKFSTQTAADPAGGRRIRQSIKLMAKAAIHESKNILQRMSESFDSNRYEAVWLSRQLIIGYPTFELLIRKPLIYDIDDAIFLSGKASYFQFKVAAERACAVIAGNNFLAEEAAKYNDNIFIVPTAVDTARWLPFCLVRDDYKSKSDVFRLGWSGTSSSFKFFLPLQEEIKQFLVDFPSAKFLIMADRFPSELKEIAFHIGYQKWSPGDEVKFIQSLDVGLMPTCDDLWSRGKCSYKMLLYAACGIPVIVTPVGNNKTILEQGDIGFGPDHPSEWYQAMRVLFNDRSVGKRLGDNGVALVRERYSVDVCAPVIAKIIKSCV